MTPGAVLVDSSVLLDVLTDDLAGKKSSVRIGPKDRFREPEGA
jgi:hypothetical protein